MQMAGGPVRLNAGRSRGGAGMGRSVGAPDGLTAGWPLDIAIESM